MIDKNTFPYNIRLFCIRTIWIVWCLVDFPTIYSLKHWKKCGKIDFPTIYSLKHWKKCGKIDFPTFFSFIFIYFSFIFHCFNIFMVKKPFFLWECHLLHRFAWNNDIVTLGKQWWPRTSVHHCFPWVTISLFHAKGAVNDSFNCPESRQKPVFWRDSGI